MARTFYHSVLVLHSNDLDVHCVYQYDGISDHPVYLFHYTMQDSLNILYPITCCGYMRTDNRPIAQSDHEVQYLPNI